MATGGEKQPTFRTARAQRMVRPLKTTHQIQIKGWVSSQVVNLNLGW